MGAERQAPGSDVALGEGMLDHNDGLLRAAADVKRPADDLARAAVNRRVEIVPAVLGDPDRRHVQMPKLIRSRDLEEAGPPATRLRALGLQQPVLAHQPLHALAVDASAEVTAGEPRDHPGAVGRVRARDAKDDSVDRVEPAALPLRQALRDAVDGLTADTRDPRDQRRRAALGDELAGPGDALAHSQPRKSSPATSTSISCGPAPAPAG